MKSFIKTTLDKLVNGKIRKEQSSSYWWDLYEAAKGRGLKAFFKKAQYNRYIEKHNAFIPLKTSFTSSPMFPHGIYGVFISSGAVVGDNCTIFHQVTIGSNTLKDSNRCGCPVIGDNVYIGCGAKIIGNVKIGNNVRIGANCVITFDIPPHSTVVLQKPRVIQKEENVNEFVTYSDFTK